MTDCETTNIQADGLAVNGDTVVGGQPPIQTVRWDWCLTHEQPHQLCKEQHDD